MPLQPQYIKKFQDWAAAKAKNLHCPMCMQKNFSVEGLSAGVKANGTSIILGGEFIPMLVVICANCAYVIHFASVPIFGADQPKDQ